MFTQRMPQGGNLAQSFGEGMKIGGAIKQQQENKALKEAFQKNTVTNEDGSMGYNQGGLLKDLARVDPRKAMQMQNQFSQQKAQAQKAQREKMMFEADQVARIAPTIQDQGSYEQAMMYLQKQGIDISQMPQAYDKGLIDRYAYSAMDIKDRMAQENKDRDYGLDRDRLAFDKSKDSFKRKQDGNKLDLEYAKFGLDREKFNKDSEFKEQKLASIREKADEKKNKLSPTQAKQKGLYELGVEAEKQFRQAVSNPNDYDPTQVGQVIDNSEWAPNWMKNDNAIAAQSAQANWVEAFLRDASGAAIPPSERMAYARDFFPVSGDTPQVVENKRKMRLRKMENARIAAGGDKTTQKAAFSPEEQSQQRQKRIAELRAKMNKDRMAGN